MVIINDLWHQIPNHNPVVELGDFVVMPNHIHGILILNKPEIGDLNVDENGDGDVNGDVDVDVETLHATSLQSQQSPNKKNQTMANISPKSNTVSAIVRSYKSAVTNHANRLGFDNGWQSRFHDHIIRNHDEYKRISHYIADNPANWCNDTFFTE
jgi:REP element-mobilizing transposase RayT